MHPDPKLRRRPMPAVVAVAVLMSAPVAAHAAGPFAGLDGYWLGTGTISIKDGTKERMRCRGQYIVQKDDTNLQLSLRCDSDSYQFHVTSYTDANEGSLSGYWSEDTRNISGQVAGRATAGRVQISVRSGSFSATMVIQLRADRQQVVIRPSAGDVTEVAATMTRAR